MTIGLTWWNDYVGNGSTAIYSYTFKIFDPEHLRVTVRDLSNVETDLDYPSQYNVSGVGLSNGGSVALIHGAFPWMTPDGYLADGIVLRIQRNVPLMQGYDFRNQSAFFAETVENALDYEMMAVQQAGINPASPTSPVGIALPFPEAGKLIGWNATADGLQNYDQSSGGGGGGSAIGTLNHIGKFISTSTIGDSLMRDNGSHVTLDIDGIHIDGTSWNQSLFGIARVHNLPDNQFGATIQTATTVVTNSPGSYEKAGLLVRAMTVDPSSYGTPVVTRDTVGIDARGEIYAPCQTGRAWGAYLEAAIHPGADGTVQALEVAVSNNGANQPEVDQPDTKLAIHIVGRGVGGTSPGHTTAGIYLDGAGSLFYKGLYGREGSFANSFVQLDKDATFTSAWRVKPSGQTLIGDLPNNGATNDYDAAKYGQLAVREMVTVVDGLTNFNALVLYSDAALSLHRIAAGRYDGTVNYWPITLEVATLEVVRGVTEGLLQFPDRGAEATLAPPGVGWLRYNDVSKNFEVSVDGSPWSAVGGSGGAVSGSGTINRVPKWAGSTTTLGNSQILDDGTSVLIGKTVADPGLILEVEANADASNGILMGNTTLGANARATMTVRSGTGSCDLTMLITSAWYVTAGGLPASTGMLRSGVDATGGMILQAAAGPIAFQPGGTATLISFLADGAIQMATTSAAAGAGKLRFNGTNWQIDNGAGWQSISTGAGSGGGWQDDGTTVRLATLTDKVVCGFATSDIADTGVLVVNQFVYAVSAAANASVLGLGIGSGVAVIASGITGSGTPLPLAFSTYVGDNVERMRIHVNGNVSIGITSDAGYKLDVNGGLRATSMGTGALTMTGSITFTAGQGIVSGGSSVVTASGGVEIYASSIKVASFAAAGAAINTPLVITGTCTATTFSGSGSLLTNLNAANLIGSVADARLSGNVPLKNSNNTFTAAQTIAGANLNFSSGFGIAASGTAVALVSSAVELYHSSVPVASFSTSGSWIYLSGSLRQVEVGAADSGGSGYRMLRCAN